MTTVGTRLDNARKIAGLSMDELARKMGFAGQSSIQRYLAPDYDLELRPDFARKFDEALGASGNGQQELIRALDIALACGADGATLLKALDVAGFRVVSKSASAGELLGFDFYKDHDPVAYVRDVMARHNISANKLAENCGLAPSTLNRPLNNEGYKYQLSTTTLRKIKEWDAKQ